MSEDAPGRRILVYDRPTGDGWAFSVWEATPEGQLLRTVAGPVIIRQRADLDAWLIETGDTWDLLCHRQSSAPTGPGWDECRRALVDEG